ncbi:MAG: hypothetical protein DRP45_03560 [Candidatus Zixiibacteriota bacterium]|nr:MAG: hypothetical protein DRP45_03560 [candidate division Zixibacteria bacterium]
MKRTFSSLGLILLACLVVVAPVLADDYLEGLQPDQKINGFTTLNVYENSAGKAMGARFVSDKYGFLIDVMQIQSVPQAFYWVKTPPTSSMGEPHACEHLLLGKGNRGRYVSALEDMALGNSSAYTTQQWTVYHFNTTAGEDTFYELFEAKLAALLNPNFEDEEILREVCHIGVNVDQETGELSLDEKGTVYTEMVSAFEQPYYSTWGQVYKMIYGKEHPLGYTSGGNPDVMRAMVPDDMWKFHKDFYRLSNMGVIVSIPSEITIPSYLNRMDEMLARCQNFEDSSEFVGIGAFDFPEPHPEPVGTTKLATYPSERQEDPGYLLYCWWSDLELGCNERFMLDLFLQTFSSGQTSNLYNLFINSQTRRIDLGGNTVYGGSDNDLGTTVYFGLEGIGNSNVSRIMLDSVGSMIVAAMRHVRDLEDGSEALREFNDRARNRLTQQKRQADNFLNSPPTFGFRGGPGGAWQYALLDLECETSFRKSLVGKERFAFAEELLSGNKNIWKERIDSWGMLTVPPYALGATPSTDIIAKNAVAKEARIAGYLNDFKKKYGTEDDQQAIASYQEEFDAKTAELEALGNDDKLPGFVDNPPMTLDDQLDWQTITLPGGVQMVASTFENMTASQVGLGLRLNVIPESLLVYVPLLPSILTNIGVIRDGQVITYDQMTERLRQEVLGLNANFSTGYTTERVELFLTGRGNNLDELKSAIGWMDAALFSPYLSADNLPRMLDLIDQSMFNLRDVTNGHEENWVGDPANAYRFQHNPLFLSTSSFMTKIHHLQRLKWMLTDPGDEQQREELAGFMTALAAAGKGKDREALVGMLSELTDAEGSESDGASSAIKESYLALSESSRKIAGEIAGVLRSSLDDIPDAHLAVDWMYLCTETRADLLVSPSEAIAEISHILDLIRKADVARMYMVSNTADREATMRMIGGLVGRLDSEHASVTQDYGSTDRIAARLQEREPSATDPLYVGLAYEGTRNGILQFTARQAGCYDTTSASVLKCLSGKLYGGGGPHGLFMNTWAAGLAYSNGYGYNPGSGRCSYYAERCPDVAVTMRFVVDLLKNAKDDPGLADYTIAQVFGGSRAASRYEQRGAAMAADLTDGFTPEMVRAFRQRVLDLKASENLYGKLKARMEESYGPVLIGYGAPLSESKDGNFFLIGPETQFELLEDLIEQAESKQTVYRLYPRDYWLAM